MRPSRPHRRSGVSHDRQRRHAALRADRDGCHKLGEENNGDANTHGNTAHLTELEVQDLVLYVFSIE